MKKDDLIVNTILVLSFAIGSVALFASVVLLGNILVGAVR
jgi:hypothetical protein